MSVQTISHSLHFSPKMATVAVEALIFFLFFSFFSYSQNISLVLLLGPKLRINYSLLSYLFLYASYFDKKRY